MIGTPCGVLGKVVASKCRVALHVLLVGYPRASVVVEIFALASKVNVVVRFVGATVFVSCRRLL